MMKTYEALRLIAEPFLPPLYAKVRAELSRLVNEKTSKPHILDVGGRKSPYTIGISAEITIIDLPRQSEVQKQLNLGLDDEIINKIKKRRSNIETMILGDMTRSDLPSNCFDSVVAVEVLEHIEEDGLFVGEVARVLKPGGTFLMTTPNGDWVENKNPDHKRHYRRRELFSLLNKNFADVKIEYASVGGVCRKMGLKSWSVRKPFQTAASIFGNVVNSYQSAGENIKFQAENTHHLFAVAVKAKKF